MLCFRQTCVGALKKLEALLSDVLHADKIELRREINRTRRLMAKNDLTGKKLENKLSYIKKKINTSIKKKQRRNQHLPRITYNKRLPITEKKEEIIDTIIHHPVIIISGETGSGKTTQIPKFCLAAGRGIEGKIGCTQPRRIAAITVASRIAEELGEETGRSVGYKIRFQDKSSPDAFIKIMTDGILLAETQGDPWLNEYDTIIVDEAHERSLNIDFILGILKTLVKKRKNLKLIITSATIDTEKFSKAFDNAPIIEVSGRMYPVDIRYLPENPESKNKDENGELTHVESAVHAVDRIVREDRNGDILVFMPTEQDIRETCELIAGRKHKRIQIFPLFARLSAKDQTRVFKIISARKIIVATNIAETSITIPGIKYVIDTGLARISRYNPRVRTTSLPVLPVSRSSADQRKGRCGRVENGVCIRLYSEEDFLARPFFTLPEILRANLAEVILRMIALKLGDIAEFPFIDRPAAKSINDGFDTLMELGAIHLQPERKSTPDTRKPHSRYRLTQNGRLMAKIPLDPRLSKMLIEAEKNGCLNEMAVITSALSVRDPRERPEEKAHAADQAHAKFSEPSSDFISLLNIWNSYHDTKKRLKSTGQIKKFCRDSFLSLKRMREWIDIHTQIRAILEEADFSSDTKISSEHESPARRSNDESGEFKPLYTAIHKSILSGYLANIAVKKEKNIFHAAKGKEVMVFPGSGLFGKAGTWIVASEMIETSRLFARTAANIDCNWLETLGGSLCRYTHQNPRWERNRGEAVADEQVSLFGLIIVPRRKVSYGKINPDEATDIFIRSALVEGDIKQHQLAHLPFLQHNLDLIDHVRDMEDRIRRRDILISDEDLFHFYRKQFDRIYDIRSLNRHVKKRGDVSLKMKQEDLVRYVPADDEVSLFPDQIKLGNTHFECLYNFKPGENDDGITVKIPSSCVSSVSPDSTDWLVPGLFEEKLIALIKALPKAYRKKLVPVSDTVDIIVKEMPRNQGSLFTALGNFLYKRFGVDIPASRWTDNSLPDHLKMRISISGAKGEELAVDRDKSVFIRNFSKNGGTGNFKTREFEAAKKNWELTNITTWDFPDLPETISLNGKSGETWTVYPGLKKEENRLSLRLFQDRIQAFVSHKDGVVVLFNIIFSKEIKYLNKNIALPKNMAPGAKYFGGVKSVQQKIVNRIMHDMFSENIRTKQSFGTHARTASTGMIQKGRELLERVIKIFDACHETRSSIYTLETGNRENMTVLQFLETIRNELSRLVPENFIELYDNFRLDHLPRYIKAIELRAQRALVNFEKDQAKADDIKTFRNRLNDLLQDLSPASSNEKRDAIEAFFWLLEEYKVSVFAQELKTPFSVSKKKLNTKLKEIQRMI